MTAPPDLVERAREIVHGITNSCSVLPSGHQQFCEEQTRIIAAALVEAEARAVSSSKWVPLVEQARAEGERIGLEAAEKDRQEWEAVARLLARWMAESGHFTPDAEGWLQKAAEGVRALQRGGREEP